MFEDVGSFSSYEKSSGVKFIGLGVNILGVGVK